MKMKTDQIKISRIRHLLTWVCMAVLLLASLALLILGWNGSALGRAFPVLMILSWLLISFSGIFLFLMAAGRTHRQLKQEEEKTTNAEQAVEHGSGRRKQGKEIDRVALARKMVRRSPEGESLEDTGKVLMQVLARELEIMSGIFYCREENGFKEVATYALRADSGLRSFQPGEGLPGQAARNRQIMVLTRLPEGYLEVMSGLGKGEPAWLALVPIVLENQTEGLLECTGYRHNPEDIEATFRIFSRDLSAKLGTTKEK